MVSDIRVAVSFKGHRKRRKFRKLLGRDDAVEFLLDLWITTAMNHPEGSLEDMDETDIALEAGWTGDANFFVQALMEAGLIERLESGKYAIHDWEEHQGYVVHAPERKEKARKAANARWGKDQDANCNAGGNAASIARPNFSNAPSPTPSPNPSPTPNPTPNPSLIGSEHGGNKINPLPQAKIEKAIGCEISSQTDAYRLAEQMYQLQKSILSISNPPDIQKWAKTFASALASGRYGDYQALSRILTWACSDNFWRGVLTSPEKLFKNHTQIFSRMLNDRHTGKSVAERRLDSNKAACEEAEKLLFGEVAHAKE